MQSVKSEHQAQTHSKRNVHLLIPYTLCASNEGFSIGCEYKLDMFRLLRLAMPELIPGSLVCTCQAILDDTSARASCLMSPRHLNTRGVNTGEAKEATAVHRLREDVSWGQRAQDIPQCAHLAGGAVQRAGGAHCRRPRGACTPPQTAHSGKPLCHTCS